MKMEESMFQTGEIVLCEPQEKALAELYKDLGAVASLEIALVEVRDREGTRVIWHWTLCEGSGILS